MFTYNRAMPVFTIVPTRSAIEVREVADLIREYRDSLRVDLSFQHFDEEVAALPGDYAEPHGVLLLARVGDAAAGCVALRPLDSATAEMKRLYVSPAYRGMNIGEALARAAIDAARERGYRAMRLDTLPSMHAARAMYVKLGFREIPPYRFNPVAGTTFLQLEL